MGDGLATSVRKATVIDIRGAVAKDFEDSEASTALADELMIGETFGSFEQRDLPQWKPTFAGAGRGQLVLINAITNGMKTTLLKLAFICAAIGRPFPPFFSGGERLRVFLLDFEGIAAQERSDIQLMMQKLTEEERGWVRENLIIAHATDIEIDGEPLNLSKPVHFAAVKKSAMRFKADVMAVDTFGSAFSVQNENDNAEIKEKVMKPMKQMAVETNMVIPMTHHIGKAKSEEGAIRVDSHRGRGASSFADLSSSVFNIDFDRDQGIVLVSCGKVKGIRPDDVALKLEPETRWLKPIAQAEVRTNYQDVLDLFIDGNERKTAEIIKALAGRVSDRTVKRLLRDGKTNGDLWSPRQGVYQAVRDRRNEA